MKKTIIFSAVSMAILASGCATQINSSAPLPVRFNNGQAVEQHKIQALSHWQIIADDMARSAAKDLNGKVVVVDQSQNDTVFGKTFNSLLTTSLVQNGAKVDMKYGSTLVSVESIQVRFKGDRGADAPAGAYTALAAGLVVLRNAVEHWSPAGVAAGLVATGVAADVANSQNGKYAGRIPQTEIVITVTATEGGRIVFRKSNVYYTDEVDANLYQKSNTLKVVGQ